VDRIYLDHAATTPLDARVLAAMSPYFSEIFGNPSSVHRYGQRAEAAIDAARETVAIALNCQPDEVVFTSGGSEADNLALRGTAAALAKGAGSKWLLTSKAEHPAISRTAQQLAVRGDFALEWLETDERGRVTAEAVERAICGETALVSVMLANNEIGTINALSEIARVCRPQGVLLHSDAVQAAAYLPVDVQALGADLVSLGGHKFYGPKGVGVLYVRKGTPLVAAQTGGGQEGGLRAGTENVPYIVGFAEALRLAVEEREPRNAHVRPLRDRIIGEVLEGVPDARLTGDPGSRLPNHASFAFKDVDGNLLLTLLDGAGFACSSGSACKTGNPEPSEVMAAIGLAREWGLGSLRVTLGMGTTPAQVDAFIQALPALVEKSRVIRQR
jgi:cysteine desulfurase